MARPAGPLSAAAFGPPPGEPPHPPRRQRPKPPRSASADPHLCIPNADPPLLACRPGLQVDHAFFDKEPEGIHLHRRQVELMDQGVVDLFRLRRCGTQPPPYGLILVARDLFCGAQAPPAHHHQQRVCHFRRGVGYIAVPRVGPNERLQLRQTQRGCPSLLPFFTIWVAPQRGQGGWLDKVFVPSSSPPVPNYTIP
jgi:hypothetical protein